MLADITVMPQDYRKDIVLHKVVFRILKDAKT